MLNVSKKSVILSFIFSLLYSNVAHAETLKQVYLDAKANDPTLQAAESAYLATTEKQAQALSRNKPTITLNGGPSFNLLSTRRTFNEVDNASGNLNYNLRLNKPLYDRTIYSQWALADASSLSAKINVDIARQDLIIRTAETYFDYLTAKATYEFSLKETQAVVEQNKRIQAFFDLGRSTITEKQEGKAQLDLAKSQEVIALQSLNIAREQLHSVTTKYYEKLYGANADITLVSPKPDNISTWSKQSSTDNLNVLLAKQAVTIAQKTVDLERSQNNLTANLFASHSGNTTQGNDSVNQDRFDASIGIDLNYVFSDGGAKKSRIREARHTVQQRLSQLESQKRNASLLTRSTFLTLQSGRASIQARKQALVSFQTAEKATKVGYSAGTRTATDVLVAIRETYQAQNNYISAQYDFLINTLKLKQSAGTLQENDLFALSKQLSNLINLK